MIRSELSTNMPFDTYSVHQQFRYNEIRKNCNANAPLGE